MKIKTSNSTESIFYFFCMCPFLFPTGLAKTNLQPYAMIISCIYIFIYLREFLKVKLSFSMITLLLTFLSSVFVLFFNEIDILALRGFSNYISICFIPLATYMILIKNDGINEKKIKRIILLWFIVGFVQIFFKRNFLIFIIGGARWSTNYRGAIGLASEPSFYGIACYFFLFLTKRFKTRKWTYYLIILIMGILFAQSAMGLIFIISFVFVDLIDEIRTPKGYRVLFGSIVISIAMFIIIKKFYSDSRLYLIISSIFNTGIDSLYKDESAVNRITSIYSPILSAFDNYLMPSGYTSRIGSGFGAILNELGVLGLGLLFIIPFELSKVFNNKSTRIISFIIIFSLLFSNTQLANPIMSFVIGINMYYSSKSIKHQTK